jgi:hypothetical protein
MGGGKAVRNLNPDFDGLLHRETTFEYLFMERLPRNKLHDDEKLPIVFPDFVDCAHIGVIQCGGSLRFLDEPGFAFLRVGQTRREKLQRDQPVKLCVLGFEDNAHAAFAELFEYLVVGDD